MATRLVYSTNARKSAAPCPSQRADCHLPKLSRIRSAMYHKTWKRTAVHRFIPFSCKQNALLFAKLSGHAVACRKLTTHPSQHPSFSVCTLMKLYVGTRIDVECSQKEMGRQEETYVHIAFEGHSSATSHCSSSPCLCWSSSDCSSCSLSLGERAVCATLPGSCGSDFVFSILKLTEGRLSCCKGDPLVSELPLLLTMDFLALREVALD